MYEWKLNKIKQPNATINYFCENATCMIVSNKKIEKEDNKMVNVMDDIYKGLNKSTLLDKIIFNHCPTNLFKMEGSINVNGKVQQYCYDASPRAVIVDKKVMVKGTKLTNQSYTTVNNAIKTNVLFDNTLDQNYLCDLKSGWYLSTKNYEFKNSLINKKVTYNICEKKATAISDKNTVVSMEKEINTNGNSPYRVKYNSHTDNKCYFVKLSLTKPSSPVDVITTFTNYGEYGAAGNPFSTFEMNLGEQSVKVSNVLSQNYRIGMDNFQDRPYYCIKGDKYLNEAGAASVVFYDDLGITSTDATKLSTNDIIKIYEKNTNNYLKITSKKPSVLAGIIIKDKNKLPPVYIPGVINKDANVNLLEETGTKGSWSYNNNANGYLNFQALNKVGNDREICLVFDLFRDSRYYNDVRGSKKLKSAKDLNAISDTKFKAYVVTTNSCDTYIKPVNWTEITAIEDAIEKNIVDNNLNIPITKIAQDQVELVSNSDKVIVDTVLGKDICAVTIKCMAGYSYKSTTKTCEKTNTYIANTYQYTEDYILNIGNTKKVVTINVENSVDVSQLITVYNAVKVPGSLKSVLVCDDKSTPTAGVCTIVDKIDAICKAPSYSNTVFLDYKIYNNSSLSTPADSYNCTFITPRRVSTIVGAMPKLKVQK